MKKYLLFLALFFIELSTMGNPTLKEYQFAGFQLQPVIPKQPEKTLNYVDPVQLECLAKNIYFEAAVESTAGKLAVAQVTLNRVNSSRFPNTVCGVVKQGRHYKSGKPIRNKCAFSWYCDGKPDEPYDGQMWAESKNIAKFMLSTQMKIIDITDGATHYHANYIKPPWWVKAKVKTTQIDKHIFYKLKI